MKRALALALVLGVFSPAAALIANAFSAMPCCAAVEDSVSAPIPCCQPAICANPSPARQPKAVDTSAQPGPAAEPATQALDEVPLHIEHAESPESPPPPTRVRLALIATLLI